MFVNTKRKEGMVSSSFVSSQIDYTPPFIVALSFPMKCGGYVYGQLILLPSLAGVKQSVFIYVLYFIITKRVSFLPQGFISLLILMLRVTTNYRLEIIVYKMFGLMVVRICIRCL